jgi:hypothetical protein
MLRSLGHDDAEFRHQAAQRIHRHRSLFDQDLTGFVRHRIGLLLHCFDWHEAHPRIKSGDRPAHRLPDRRCVSRVVLVPPDILFGPRVGPKARPRTGSRGRDGGRCDRAWSVRVPNGSRCHMPRCRSGKGGVWRTTSAPASVAGTGEPQTVPEHSLRGPRIRSWQIEADSGNLRHGWLPLVGSDGIQLWHVDAVRGPSTPSWPGQARQSRCERSGTVNSNGGFVVAALGSEATI